MTPTLIRNVETTLFAGLMLASLVCCPSNAQAEQVSQSMMTVKRGLTAELNFSHRSATLKARPDQSMDAPVLVRLERLDTPPPTSESTNCYTLRFFGAVAGQYDLSEWVVLKDGSPLTGPDALPAMNVRVVSQLPPDQGTSLYEIEDPGLAIPGGYRLSLAVLALLWILVPIVSLVAWWRSRESIKPTPVVRAPTLADRLRPLVQRASEGNLSVDEQSRMELLIYVFWQKQLGLSESLVDALPALRRHAEAGGLLRTLEAWVHADAKSRPQLNPTTMNALLAPYRKMCEEELREQQIESREDAA